MTEAGTSGGDSLREKWPVWLLFVAVAVSLLLLVLTLAASDASVPRVCRRLLRLFSLRSENNFGAWWSGILLFLPALLAIDAAMAERANPARARGWYVLSAIFLALSADEIGSTCLEKTIVKCPSYGYGYVSGCNIRMPNGSSGREL